MDRLTNLRERLVECQADAQTIVDAAKNETRDMTADEAATVKKKVSEFSEIKAQIEAETAVADMSVVLSQSAGRSVPAQPPAVQNGESGDVTRSPAVARDPEAAKRQGFNHFGEFAASVRAANPQNGAGFQVDQRLAFANAPTTVGSEGVGADGGFAVPDTFRDEIMSFYNDEASLFSMTDQQQTSGNTFCVPIDETTPWQTTGGVLAYWDGENDQLTQSKPSLRDGQLRLNKLTALVPVTNELLEDAPAMSGYVPRKAGQKMAFKSDLAIVQGSGSGQPLGIINSGCLVSVAKEGSQVADTITGLNITKMYSRMYAPWRRSAVWLINQDIEPQLLHLMKIGKLETGGNDTGWGSTVPHYDPVTDTLMGRPIIRTQACETLGDKGDIIFANMPMYLTVVKSSGVRSEVSMHLWFDYDTTAFRFIFRQAGQPWLTTTMAARDGSATYSAFVTLDARA